MRVTPAIIDVERCMRAVGNRVAKGANHYRVRRGHHIYRIQEEKRRGREFEGEDVQVSSVVAAARRGDVRGRIGAAVVGHRPAVAFDRVADSQVPSLDGWVIGASDPVESNAVAPDLLADCNRDRLLAAEGHLRECVSHDVS